MKQLLAGIVLIVVLGVGALVYRNVQERPSATPPGSQIACTMEAKVCPDGMSIGRSGPDCAFAACAAPNVELPQAGIAFVLPAGYAANSAAPGTDTTLVTAYEKSSATAGNQPDAIVVRRYPIPAGKTANDVMLANTMYESSGNQPKAMTEFSPVIVNAKTFQSITVERFEGHVHTVYYLPRAADVLRFEILERSVTNWTDPKLDVTKLPGNQALLRMLATLQTK